MRIAQRVAPAVAAAALLSSPATALAAGGNPTQSAYGPTPPAHIVTCATTTSGSGSSSANGCNGTLPFTGIDIVPLAAIGVGLVGSGAVLRRRYSRSH